MAKLVTLFGDNIKKKKISLMRSLDARAMLSSEDCRQRGRLGSSRMWSLCFDKPLKGFQ